MRLILAALLLTACAGKQFNSLHHYWEKRGISPPSEKQFQTCRAYGCQKIDTIELTDKEWRQIEKPFRVKANSARVERKKLAQSIAEFEKIVGHHNGTSEDIWGTFQKTGHKQQDCVDESTNTSIYISALKNRGHLHFHEVVTPQSRFPLIKWPHQTAVIVEKETNTSYAVDSWFHNNGMPPEIIELKIWKDGWKPQERQ